MMPKLSRWFPANVKPVHVGVYQFPHFIKGEYWYRKWNGRTWMWGGKTPEIAAASTLTLPNCRNERWRGLARKP